MSSQISGLDFDISHRGAFSIVKSGASVIAFPFGFFSIELFDIASGMTLSPLHAGHNELDYTVASLTTIASSSGVPIVASKMYTGTVGFRIIELSNGMGRERAFPLLSIYGQK